MSEKNVRYFFNEVLEDEVLQEKVKAVKSIDELLSLAEATGYPFTSEEFGRYRIIQEAFGVIKELANSRLVALDDTAPDDTVLDEAIAKYIFDIAQAGELTMDKLDAALLQNAVLRRKSKTD